MAFGTIDNPLKKINPNGYDDLFGTAGGQPGLMFFISNVIKLLTIGAGLFAFINLILAGFDYISSGGDTKKISGAWGKINMSLIGLVVIVLSYSLAAIIGLILFHDPTAILNPKIYGPGSIAPPPGTPPPSGI